MKAAAVSVIVLFSLLSLVYLKREWDLSRRQVITDSSKPSQSSRASPQTPTASSATGPAYIELPLNPAATSVGVGFRGHDIKRIYSSLLDAESKQYKNEFETTPQFRERMKQLAGAPFFGGLSRTSIYAFAVETTAMDYDADRESLMVKVGIDKDMLPARAFHDGYMSIFSWGKTFPGSSYLGTNAFGVTTPLEVSTSVLYYIAFRHSVVPVQSHGFVFRGYRTVLRDYIFRIHVASSEARDAKEKLAVVAICRLVPPFTDDFERKEKPTITSPKEDDWRYSYVSVDILDLWLYDIATGRILQKLRAPSFR